MILLLEGLGRGGEGRGGGRGEGGGGGGEKEMGERGMTETWRYVPTSVNAEEGGLTFTSS